MFSLRSPFILDLLLETSCVTKKQKMFFEVIDNQWGKIWEPDISIKVYLYSWLNGLGIEICLHRAFGFVLIVTDKKARLCVCVEKEIRRKGNAIFRFSNRVRPFFIVCWTWNFAATELRKFSESACTFYFIFLSLLNVRVNPLKENSSFTNTNVYWTN